MTKWFGTSYRFHPLFVVVMMASIATGYFLELATLFGIVFIHELGHVAAAKSFGWKVKEVQLLPFGGVAVVEEQGGISAWEEIAVALAGPMQNGLMILFALVMQWSGLWDSEWVAYFMKANIMIGGFNLIPILPLDGGKVLQAICSYYLPYHRTIICCTWVSLCLSMAMIIISAVHLYTAGIQFNLLLIGLFLFYTNWYGYRNVPFLFFRFLMHRDGKASKMIERGAHAQPIVVGMHRSVAQIMRLFMREKYHLIYVMNDKGVIQAVLPEQRLLNTYFIDNKPGSAVSELFM